VGSLITAGMVIWIPAWQFYLAPVVSLTCTFCNSTEQVS